MYERSRILGLSNKLKSLEQELWDSGAPLLWELANLDLESKTSFQFVSLEQKRIFLEAIVV